MLRFFELAPSPNNVKVRLALRYKDVPFETVPVDPSDRAPVVALTGQPFTPAIEDRGIALFDSEAILRYLDANYRDAPRLLGTTKEHERAAERFRRELDRRVAEHWAPIFMHGIGAAPPYGDDDVRGYHDGLAWLEETLTDDAPLVDAAVPICDLRAAVWVVYALPGEALLARVPFLARFREMFGVEAGRFPRLERFVGPWNARLS